MTKSIAKYEFITTTNDNLFFTAEDALTAFLGVKKQDKDNYRRLAKFEKSQLPPEGYLLLNIGYGLSVAYKRRID